VNEYPEDNTQVEFITIVEGPIPEFTSTPADWPWSLHDGLDSTMVAVCRLRTLDGDAMIERCTTAWQEGRLVRLDYPDGEGGRQEAEVVAVQTELVEEGDVLVLWVNL
jgi:hypothetical protein